MDIDVYRPVAREVAEPELRRAAAMDIGDWFRFEIGAPRPVADSEGGVRLPVTAFVGNTVWASFHVDLVGPGLRMTGEPEKVPPLARVGMPDVEQHGYRVCPLVDHVADQVCAIFERPGAARVSSTRYNDLVDLVAIVLARPVEAGPQIAALRSEAPPTRVAPARASGGSRPVAAGAGLRGRGSSLPPAGHADAE